jgi:hypothetical protein
MCRHSQVLSSRLIALFWVGIDPGGDFFRLGFRTRKVTHGRRIALVEKGDWRLDMMSFEAELTSSANDTTKTSSTKRRGGKHDANVEGGWWWWWWWAETEVAAAASCGTQLSGTSVAPG